MSEVKVNKISPRSGTTVTLGDSGDTFTIPSGATINNQGTATNFGPTGSVSWQTTVKSAGFTATAGEGYFIDTSSGAISVNLPAGTAGAVVGFSDYAQSFDTNALTLVQNGSDKIAGNATNSQISTEGIAVTLVFVDSTKGWIVTDSGLQSEAPGPVFISATGGNSTTTVGDFKVHAFTSPGTFTVCSVGNAAGSNTVETMIVAGGGGAGFDRAGGAGAGGMVLTPTCGISVTATGFPISVGAGGAGIPNSLGPGSHAGCSGTNSTGFSLTAAGGGASSRGGNSQPLAQVTGKPGGSAGGGSAGCTTVGPGGTATQPTQPGNSGSFGKGFAGGAAAGPGNQTGGGGGAGGVGVAAVSGSSSGAGGPGFDVSPRFGTAPQPFYIANGPLQGASVGGIFAGGGGGGASGGASAPSTSGGNGGPGGGGHGGDSPSNPGDRDGHPGTANTGGGGGGSSNISPSPDAGGNGGSGIVLIRYKFQ
jgi:hypothetical protein